MILHYGLDDTAHSAQHSADAIDRQEVTIDWYLEHMYDYDYPFFRWIDNQSEMGLDPWRYHMDFPIDSEEAKKRGWRIFVQRKDFVKLYKDTGRVTYSITGHAKHNNYKCWNWLTVLQNDTPIFMCKSFSLAERVVRERIAEQDYILSIVEACLLQAGFDPSNHIVSMPLEDL